MMSRRASFDIFQGNATLFLFRDAFAPHRRDPACTDELAAPAPASEPEISPDGDPYGRSYEFQIPSESPRKTDIESDPCVVGWTVLCTDSLCRLIDAEYPS